VLRRPRSALSWPGRLRAAREQQLTQSGSSDGTGPRLSQPCSAPSWRPALSTRGSSESWPQVNPPASARRDPWWLALGALLEAVSQLGEIGLFRGLF